MATFRCAGEEWAKEAAVTPKSQHRATCISSKASDRIENAANFVLVKGYCRKSETLRV